MSRPIHALVASPNKSAYVAAKHGLLGLTRATALEAGPRGVTANAVCPAYVRTPLVERQMADLAATEGMAIDEIIDKVMLAPAAIRRLIEPEEVARYVAFHCSDDAASITGTAQVIDGGLDRSLMPAVTYDRRRLRPGLEPVWVLSSSTKVPFTRTDSIPSA